MRQIMKGDLTMVYDNEIIEHAEIGRGSYRNFSGVKSDYNRAGERRFSIFLPQEAADCLEETGWYIKHKPPYREGDDPVNQLDIAVSYDTKDGKFQPPLVKLFSWDGVKTVLNEETVGMLDSMDIEDAKVTIRPYNWDVNGKTGCKAYLQELEVHVRPPRRVLNGNRHRDEEEDF